MNGKSIYKVPDGKLLKLFVDFEGKRINHVKITGDFFMYPENSIEKIEAGLAGKELDEAALANEIKRIAAENRIEFFGVNGEAIARAIMIAGGKE